MQDKAAIYVKAEFFVLCGCLYSQIWACDAVLNLEVDDFQPGTHNRDIYRIIKKLVETGREVNYIAVASELPDRDGINVYAAGLDPFCVISKRHFMDYVNQVKEYGRKYRIKKLTNRFNAESNNGETAVNIVKRLISDAQQIADDGRAPTGANIEDAVQEHDNFVDALLSGEVTTIGPPFPELNDIILYPGNQAVIGAHTSVGKSAFAVHWATSLARTGKRVLFISAEMTQIEMIQRVASDVAGLGIGLMRKRNVKLSNHPEMLEFRSAINDMSGELRIRYIPGANEIDIGSELDTMANRGGTDVLFVDYIQALECQEMGRRTIREQIGFLSRWLRKQSDKRGMVTVVLSQLSRPGKEDRYTNREPTIWDLKESGNLENDPDVVILLHREKTESKRDWNIKVRCVKNRNGSLCDWTYTFDSWTAQWT